MNRGGPQLFRMQNNHRFLNGPARFLTHDC
jgi:hypothetical protein